MPNQEKQITKNNCSTFAEDVVKQDPKVKEKTPSSTSARPLSAVKEYQEKFSRVYYDPNEKEE